MTIRDAAPAEADRVDALIRRVYSEYASIMEPPAWEGLRLAVERALEDRGRADRIVAVRGGELVGTVMLFPPDTGSYGEEVGVLAWPEVRLLAVVPEARGLGIGRALMEESIRRARDSGASHLGLHSSRSMAAAQAMYREMGFVRNPEFDFQPPGAELVEAFTLRIRS